MPLPGDLPARDETPEPLGPDQTNTGWRSTDPSTKDDLTEVWETVEDIYEGLITDHDELTDVRANQHTHAHTPLDGSGQVAHSNLSGVTGDQHHAESHSHTSHTGIGVDDHHNKAHVHDGDASGTVAHSSLSGLTSGDPHTQYRLESEDHSHASSGAQGGQVSHADLTALTTGDPHTQYRLESADHTHTASGLQGGTVQHSDLTGLTADDHTQYQKEAEKSQANGYASLGSGALVPTAELGSGTASSATFLRGDQTYDNTVYSTPIETLYSLVTECNIPVASIADIELQSAGSSGSSIGFGFGNDDGMFALQSGGTANNYRSLSIQSNTGTRRTLALSSTAHRVKCQFSVIGALTNKILIVGLGSASVINSAYQAAGANTGCFFRIDAAGAGVNWFAVTKNGASETTTNSGVADAINAGSTSQLFTVEIVATSTSVKYYLSTGANVSAPTLIATHTTNIPTAAIGFIVGVMTKNTTSQGIELRWLKFQSPRTNVL